MFPNNHIGRGHTGLCTFSVDSILNINLTFYFALILHVLFGNNYEIPCDLDSRGMQ